MNIASTVFHINIAKASLGRYLVYMTKYREVPMGGGGGGGAGGGVEPLVLDDEAALRNWLSSLAKEVI